MRNRVPEAEGAAMRRLAALDGLRLVCALAVAGYHFGDSWRLDGVRPPAAHLPIGSHVLIYGFLGVEVFFMISGFVITLSGWDRTVREFVASRAARLYPAFWACVLLTAVVVTAVPLTAGVPVTGVPSWSDVAINLTMFAGPLDTKLVDTVYWTLWAELRFYLIFACLIGGGVTERRLRLFCTGWLIAAVLLPLLHPGDFLRELVMPDFAPYFIAGATMFLLRRSPRDRRLWVLLAGCWAVSLHRVLLRTLDLKPGFAVPVWPSFVLVTCAYALLLAIALGWTDRITWRWLGTAGALTYPFYLLHQRIGYVLIRGVHLRTGLPAEVVIAGGVVVLLCVAWLVHRLVERPLAPLLRRLIVGASTSPVATAAVPDMSRT